MTAREDDILLRTAAHIAEAGADGLSLTAQVRSQDQSVMVAIQNCWSQVGVNLDVQTIDAGLWANSRKNGTLQVTLVTWSTLSFIGVEFMASYFYSPNASQRSSFYNSSAFDGYVDAARHGRKNLQAAPRPGEHFPRAGQVAALQVIISHAHLQDALV